MHEAYELVMTNHLYKLFKCLKMSSDQMPNLDDENKYEPEL